VYATVSPTRELPAIFGIFQRALGGDDALLRLAQLVFERAGLGAEVYPATVEEALRDWIYVPKSRPEHMVHLPRHWDLLLPTDRDLVVTFARALSGRARGLVLHDHAHWVADRIGLSRALAELDRSLRASAAGPMVFIEYASGLDPDLFGEITEEVTGHERLSACIDTGHVAIFSARRCFEQRHPGMNAFDLVPSSTELGRFSADLEQAKEAARTAVTRLVERVARRGRPLHLHLHDAHLLAAQSLYGLRDHLSFREPIPVSKSLSVEGEQPTMLAVEGLTRLLGAALRHLSPPELSLTLEIHLRRAKVRKPLGPYGALFVGWTDLTDAEVMYEWTAALVEEHAWLKSILQPLISSAGSGA
jgi:hypothetical protein